MKFIAALIAILSIPLFIPLMLPSPVKAEISPPDLRILFQGESKNLPAGSGRDLALLLKKIKNDHHQRIFIHAFAARAGKPSWEAQRLALGRALAVRDYLIQKSIAPKRIILKPLGNLCAVPCQRVDIFLTK